VIDGIVLGANDKDGDVVEVGALEGDMVKEGSNEGNDEVGERVGKSVVFMDVRIGIISGIRSSSSGTMSVIVSS